MGLDNVTFIFDANAEFSENTNVPYSVAGEDERDFKPLPASLLTSGSHQVTATPEKGEALTLNFILTE